MISFQTIAVCSKKLFMVQGKDPAFGIELLPNFWLAVVFGRSTQTLVYLPKKESFWLYMLMIYC